MPNIKPIDLKEKARANARTILAESASFKTMDFNEQKAIYQDIVKSEYKKLAKQHGLAKGMAEGNQPARADRDFDPNYDAGIEGFRDLVDSVDFPQFVSDLLRSVFDANINVMRAQTEEYMKLMKAATTDLATFINKIDDTTTFAYLAENQQNKYGITMERDGDKRKMVLTDPEGERLDVDDNEVKKSIMDAKIKMAQEHRTALREMILMGVTRLVVKKGKVKAGVIFDFKADRSLTTDLVDTTETNTTVEGEFGYGAFFSPYKVNGGFSRSKSKITVATTNSVAEEELRAKLSGDVEIEFATDYFKLDNFAEMYGPVPQGGGQGQQGGKQPAG